MKNIISMSGLAFGTILAIGVCGLAQAADHHAADHHAAGRSVKS